MNDRVQAVERGIDVLMAVADGTETLTEIARITNLSKATASRLLSSLSHGQMVVRDPLTKEYLLGPGCFRLFQDIVHSYGWATSLARPTLEWLRDVTGETATIHIRGGQQRVCIAELPSNDPIRYTALVGSTAPLHVGSAGKVILAALRPKERNRLLAATSLPQIAPGTITDRTELEQEVQDVQSRGWAASSGERISGAAAISVPLHGPQGMVAALSILGPAFRLTTEKQQEFLPFLQRAAHSIEAALQTHSPATGLSAAR